MSDRRIDITGLQVLAGVLATVTGAVAASYLGVAGTIIGAAVMSVASTAGSAVYKHYLGQTAGRLKEFKEAAPVAAHRATGRIAATGARTEPHRHGHVLVSEDELPTMVLPVTELPFYGQEPAWTAGTAGGDEPGTADGDEPGATGGYRPETAGGYKPGAASGYKPGVVGGYKLGAVGRGERGERALGGAGRWRSWLRQRPGWLLGTVATVGLFAGVVGGISVFELAAGKPLDAVVWHRSGSGTTIDGVVGGRSPHSTAPAVRTGRSPGKASPSPGPSGSATSSPSLSPTPSPGSPSPTSSGSPSPTPSSSSPSPSPTGP